MAGWAWGSGGGQARSTLFVMLMACPWKDVACRPLGKRRFPAQMLLCVRSLLSSVVVRMVVDQALDAPRSQCPTYERDRWRDRFFIVAGTVASARSACGQLERGS